MGKPKQERRLAETEAEAVVRNLRVSPRKLNLVAGLIRNQDAGDAVATLTFSKRRIAAAVRKALESAIANAENNHQLDVDRLFVSRAEVGRAVVMRRFHARGKGRAARIEKWFSHLRIVVAEREEETEEAAPPPRAQTAKRADATPRVPAENIAPENAPPPPEVAPAPAEGAP
jgi:large subunit ribosomal protein L22